MAQKGSGTWRGYWQRPEGITEFPDLREHDGGAGKGTETGGETDPRYGSLSEGEPGRKEGRTEPGQEFKDEGGTEQGTEMD